MLGCIAWLRLGGWCVFEKIFSHVSMLECKKCTCMTKLRIKRYTRVNIFRIILCLLRIWIYVTLSQKFNLGNCYAINYILFRQAIIEQNQNLKNILSFSDFIRVYFPLNLRIWKDEFQSRSKYQSFSEKKVFRYILLKSDEY